jgi:hypothetical protein
MTRFCAFHPNLAIVPSLPLLFVLPVTVLPDTTRLGWPLSLLGPSVAEFVPPRVETDHRRLSFALP